MFNLHGDGVPYAYHGFRSYFTCSYSSSIRGESYSSHIIYVHLKESLTVLLSIVHYS